MITIFFGEMGTGKSYHAKKRAVETGACFLEGDNLIPYTMTERVKGFKPLTIEMVADFVINHLTPAIIDRANIHTDVCVSQALYCDDHRIYLKAKLKEAGHDVRFVWVRAKPLRNAKQIFSRPWGTFWTLYWLMNKPFFQEPTHEHECLGP